MSIGEFYLSNRRPTPTGFEAMKNLGKLILLGIICLGCGGRHDSADYTNGKNHGGINSTRDILGVTHVAGKYCLTDKDFLNEGADQILSLGSRVIKIWFYGKRFEPPEAVYPYHSHWPTVKTLVEGAQLPYFQQLFLKPFTTYIMVVTSLGRPDDYWRNGITEQQAQDEQRQFYELARYLLTAYRGTGKTFVLQHWEGDWMLRGHNDEKIAPSAPAIKNMIVWLNARQAGVEQARKEIGQDGVYVYHAAEVNRVIISMREHRPGVVNAVLPHTRLDLVSYSAWDATVEYREGPQLLRDALDYIAEHMPDSAAFGSHNVYLGEFGMPENEFTTEQIRQVIPAAVETALDWGCPYVVYWQLYCNELAEPRQPPPIHSNQAVRGFWLIRPDGSKAQIWDYFYHRLNYGENQVLLNPALP